MCRVFKTQTHTVRRTISKEHAHNEVDLVSALAGSLNRKGPQRAELGRKQQIRAWPIDHVGKLASIPDQIRSQITGRNGESSRVSGKGIVLACGNIEFKFCGWPELELAPSANRA